MRISHTKIISRLFVTDEGHDTKDNPVVRSLIIQGHVLLGNGNKDKCPFAKSIEINSKSISQEMDSLTEE